MAQSLLNPPRSRTSKHNENNNKLRTNKHHELASSGSCSSSLGPLLVTAWFRALWMGQIVFNAAASGFVGLIRKRLQLQIGLR